ncbi:glycerate dehydrogenase [Thioalkalivibrio denitrificans]|uniref:Glycerate dehydrogenase n=1 Tax=Thioalkalivibrio denitrificans TaxID=108003 RepID=A0A1V3NQ23_9GAMM|nr:2-hydroxyacid dehydrogenase [Thioalkalivibrio denitrificans]OOG27141.1 glycerate dehydrogenase [Thioalkalivibrio denitrificans]
MTERGVFLDLETVDRDDLDLNALRSTLSHWEMHPYTGSEEVGARIAGAQVVVSNKVVLDAAAIESAPDLRLICVAATGTNNVDLETARKRGVTVCNVRDYATAAVSQHVFAMILALTTRLNAYQRDVAEGRWQESRQFCLLDHPIRELEGLTLGIIGYGALGQGVARAAKAFGLNVAVAESLVSPGRDKARWPLERLLAESDIISLHCPLTEQTHHLIDADALEAMKSDALLINTARGAIVDNAALATALRQGIIGGAGIDVLEQEPPPPDHPLLARDIPNLILTPHIAWAAREARQRVIDQVAANIRAFIAGDPRNVV